MGENECKGDVPGHPLKPIPLVARESVISQVGVTALSDPNADDRVKKDRQENERPFDDGQEGNAVNGKNSILEDIRPPTEARIGNKVHTHVGTHGNQTAERMEPAN
jgi:hypothetical protein